MVTEVTQSTFSGTAEIPKTGQVSDALLCNMELPLRGIFYPLGYAVEIITNEPLVLKAASESFGHVRAGETNTVLQIRIGVSDGSESECPPEPVRREYNHLFSLVANADNQALLDLRTCTGFIWVKRSTVNHRLYFRYSFLEKPVYVLLGSSVVTDLHAACVSKNGKGILLCGDSGAGKSTLAYACARAGWTYTSDDTSYLINNSEVPRVFGHSHRLRFRPAARSLFPELESHKLAPRLEGKPSIEVPTSEFPDLVTANVASVHAIVYLNRSSSGTGRLTLFPEGTGIMRLAEQLYSTGEIRLTHEKALQAFSRIPAYELQYRDLDQAIDQLNSLTGDV